MEWLKEHLGEELYNQLTEKLKGNDKVKLANLAGGEYVGKDKFTAAETARKELEGQIKERDTQLETLKKSAGDNAGLQSEIVRLQTANTTAKTDFESKLKAAQLEHALEGRLLQAGAVNTKAVKALLDSTKISMDGDNLVGVDEQLKTLKEKETWAFITPTIPGAGGNPAAPADGVKAALPKGMQIL